MSDCLKVSADGTASIAFTIIPRKNAQMMMFRWKHVDDQVINYALVTTCISKCMDHKGVAGSISFVHGIIQSSGAVRSTVAKGLANYGISCKVLQNHILGFADTLSKKHLFREPEMRKARGEAPRVPKNQRWKICILGVHDSGR